MARETASNQPGGAVDRTIIVENPEDKLSDRLEWAEEQREGAQAEGVTVDVVYFEAYKRVLVDLLEDLHTDGLSEAGLYQRHQTRREEWEDAEKSPDTVEHAAVADATKHVLDAFFGYGVTELGEVSNSTVYDDGTVQFVGEDGDAVRLQIRDEDDALAKADLFLHEAGRSIDDLRDRNEAIR